MTNSLTVAVLAGLCGMVGWGSADFFAKTAIDRIGPIRSLVWAHFFGALCFIAAALINTFAFGRPLDLPHGATTYVGLLFFGLLQLAVYWFAYLAFEKGKVALLNPIFASYSGVVVLASLLLFSEPTTVLFILALALIFIGVVFLNIETEGRRIKRIATVAGLREILIATGLAAIWTLGWDKFLGHHAALPYALFMYVFMSAGAYALARSIKAEMRGVSGPVWKYLALMGASETVAYLGISWGFSSTDKTSIVALIGGAFSVPTVVLAYIFLKERLTVVQWGAVATIILGIVLVAVG